jgi:hypothetical protein
VRNRLAEKFDYKTVKSISCLHKSKVVVVKQETDPYTTYLIDIILL